MNNYKAMWEQAIEHNAWITAQNERLKGNKRENPTLRDQFAMAAMTGLLAKPSVVSIDVVAEAYKIADRALSFR